MPNREDGRFRGHKGGDTLEPKGYAADSGFRESLVANVNQVVSLLTLLDPVGFDPDNITEHLVYG
jgi:hypothetical protein